MADEECDHREQRLHHPYLAAERAWYSAFGIYVSGQDGASVFFAVSGGRRGPEVGEFIPIIGRFYALGYSSPARYSVAAH